MRASTRSTPLPTEASSIAWTTRSCATSSSPSSPEGVGGPLPLGPGSDVEPVHDLLVADPPPAVGLVVEPGVVVRGRHDAEARVRALRDPHEPSHVEAADPGDARRVVGPAAVHAVAEVGAGHLRPVMAQRHGPYRGAG